MVLLGARRCGKWGDVGQREQTFNYKLNKLQGSNAQDGDYSYQYDVVYLKVVMGVKV